MNSLLLTNDLTAPVMEEALQHKVGFTERYNPATILNLLSFLTFGLLWYDAHRIVIDIGQNEKKYITFFN